MATEPAEGPEQPLGDPLKRPTGRPRVCRPPSAHPSASPKKTLRRIMEEFGRSAFFCWWGNRGTGRCERSNTIFLNQRSHPSTLTLTIRGSQERAKLAPPKHRQAVEPKAAGSESMGSFCSFLFVLDTDLPPDFLRGWPWNQE